ncbi:hypothetical protein IV203_004379 [Nitzschia inconspicua]|uniref:Transmembrane protein n=1 Tax=Nitzschia inconspicua TaxID=303405 RepID=A0A9K3L5I0_9STRA|nr:hypothetical protein IV203_004379 [Nitzschia inconspicua]
MTLLSTSLPSLLLLVLCFSSQTIDTDASRTLERSGLGPRNSGFEALQGNRKLQAVRTDLVRLIPFDVQIALRFEDSSDLESINMVGVTDIITDWMADSFRVKSTSELMEESDNEESESNGTVTTTLNSVALEQVNRRIQTTTVSASQPLALLTVSYGGISLWDRAGTAAAMDSDLVELMQRATFLEDNVLLQMLVASDPSLTGFPFQESVIDVRAYITPPSDQNNNNTPTQAPTESNKNLEIIIIVAIVVACLAFALLIFAVIWAWKSDSNTKPRGGASARSKASSKKAAAAVSSQKSANSSLDPKKKGSIPSRKEPKKVSSPEQPPKVAAKDQLQGSALDFGGSSVQNDAPSSNVATINDPYTQSVVSEDISSSLTAYYKSGMFGDNRGMMKNDFNDAASMSSMDSYGYSLDGYAPSLGPAQGGYPVGPLQAAKVAQITVGDEDDDAAARAAEEEEVEDYESQA